MNLSEQLLQKLEEADMGARDDLVKGLNRFSDSLNKMGVNFSDVSLDAGESGLTDKPATEYIVSAVASDEDKVINLAKMIGEKQHKKGIEKVEILKVNRKNIRIHTERNKNAGWLNTKNIDKGDGNFLIRILFIHSDDVA